MLVPVSELTPICSVPVPAVSRCCPWREEKGEKLDACKFDSVLCKMAMFLCLIALCRVMIVSETLSFIKWV